MTTRQQGLGVPSPTRGGPAGRGQTHLLPSGGIPGRSVWKEGPRATPSAAAAKPEGWEVGVGGAGPLPCPSCRPAGAGRPGRREIPRNAGHGKRRQRPTTNVGGNKMVTPTPSPAKAAMSPFTPERAWSSVFQPGAAGARSSAKRPPQAQAEHAPGFGTRVTGRLPVAVPASLLRQRA